MITAGMAISVWWGKKLPSNRRDMVAGYILTVVACGFNFVFMTIVIVAYRDFSDGMGVLAVQAFFEIFMTAVYVWARDLAKRAGPQRRKKRDPNGSVGGPTEPDPSAEAKLLIWVIFDHFAFLHSMISQGRPSMRGE